MRDRAAGRSVPEMLRTALLAAGLADAQADWSPDGTRISCRAMRSTRCQMAVADLTVGFSLSTTAP